MPPAISLLASPAPASLPVEMVERKGVGHPDSICDALVEHLSVTLSRAYIERFGTILHHNVDKALLCAGAARPAFGGGEILEPIEIYLSGRVTTAAGDVRLPVETLAIEACRSWIRTHLRFVDPVRDVRVLPRLRPTSPDLAALFLRRRPGDVALANDTSFGVGFAPLDTLERAVLAVEGALAADATRRAHPAIGDDVKVMGVRRGDATDVTVACALVGRHLRDLGAYHAAKGVVAQAARAAAEAAGAAAVQVAVNAADGDTADSVYLTVTGLSAESGDDGQVGRGNRLNGLITPYRPMSLEAVAGKNPVTHVGKLYNVIAQRTADAAAAVPGVEEAQCFLVSRIGRPLDEPQAFELQVRLADPHALAALTPRLAEVASAELARVGSVWRDAIAGTLRVC